MNKLEVLCHSSIRIQGDKVIYIDPYKIEKKLKDADYIFFTHSHYDHFSEEDLQKVIKKDTILILPNELKQRALLFQKDETKIICVVPDQQYQVNSIDFHTTFAYNENKPYHPKENNWVGYIINFQSTSYYIAGDTDNIDEIQKIECDIALLPIGGKYTMNYEEAATLANTIKAKTVIPTHYDCIIGDKEDADQFSNLVKGKEVKILIK